MPNDEYEKKDSSIFIVTERKASKTSEKKESMMILVVMSVLLLVFICLMGAWAYKAYIVHEQSKVELNQMLPKNTEGREVYDTYTRNSLLVIDDSTIINIGKIINQVNNQNFTIAVISTVNSMLYGDTSNLEVLNNIQKLNNISQKDKEYLRTIYDEILRDQQRYVN